MADTRVTAYLQFAGNCEEALEFYQKALGANVTEKFRFKDSPEPLPPGMVPPGYDDKIMHTSFSVGDTQIMASDGCEEGTKFSGFSLSIQVPNQEIARRYFDALANGGKVEMPLSKTFWSPCFGMLTDRFGLSWMISAEE